MGLRALLKGPTAVQIIPGIEPPTLRGQVKYLNHYAMLFFNGFSSQLTHTGTFIGMLIIVCCPGNNNLVNTHLQQRAFDQGNLHSSNVECSRTNG